MFHRHRLPVASAPGGTASAYRIGHERALLVDPATPVTVDAGVEVAHVALTHHHPDHAGGVTAHADATVWARAGRTDAFERATGVTPDRTFREDDHVPTDAGPVTVVETPGHAPEHVAFALPGDVGERRFLEQVVVRFGDLHAGSPDASRKILLARTVRFGRGKKCHILVYKEEPPPF